MKIDRKKIELIMARKCLRVKDISETSGVPRHFLDNAMAERGVRPHTAGGIARALGVDVTEILADDAD